MTTIDFLRSALADIDRARERLHQYATQTDSPEAVVVHAADLLDAARETLDKAL